VVCPEVSRQGLKQAGQEAGTQTAGSVWLDVTGGNDEGLCRGAVYTTHSGRVGAFLPVSVDLQASLLCMLG
jgi:hypothetical protein